MVFTIIIVLIVALVLIGIIVNAIQQHKNKIESERKTELSVHKGIIETTEAALLDAEQIPVSQRLIFILQRRVLSAMKAAKQLDDASGDKGAIKTMEENLKRIDINTPPPSEDAFQLPHSDKQVIKFIRGIKTLRSLLRSEFKKEKIESRVFLSEDKLLERLQLRANVDTLIRRGEGAMKNNQLGSARQCIEKAIGALAAQPDPDQFIVTRQTQLEDKLRNIESSLKSVNSRDVAKKKASERNELDELFSEKKKW